MNIKEQAEKNIKDLADYILKYSPTKIYLCRSLLKDFVVYFENDNFIVHEWPNADYPYGFFYMNTELVPVLDQDLPDGKLWSNVKRLGNWPPDEKPVEMVCCKYCGRYTKIENETCPGCGANLEKG